MLNPKIPTIGGNRNTKESKALRYILRAHSNHQNQNRDDRSNNGIKDDYDDDRNVAVFFERIYQKSVALYRTTGRRYKHQTEIEQSHTITPWSQEEAPNSMHAGEVDEDCIERNNPLVDIFENGFSVLHDLLTIVHSNDDVLHSSDVIKSDPSNEKESHHPSRHSSTSNRNDPFDGDEDDCIDDVVYSDNPNILLFQNREMVPREIRMEKYSTGNSANIIGKDPVCSTASTTNILPSRRTTLNLYAAYLDGCSIVINHADSNCSTKNHVGGGSSPYIAALCNDLTNSFPHVYANVYITPLPTQTVPPHADDRDVFIIQVLGYKNWTIYKNIPIPYPYPDEQVGKPQPSLNGNVLPIPDAVLNGPILFSSILQPGDVLYIPRGYVHEAQGYCYNAIKSKNEDDVNDVVGVKNEALENQLFGSSKNIDCSFHITIAIATHDWSLQGILQSATQNILSSSLPIEYRMAISRNFGQQTSLLSPAPPPVLTDSQRQPTNDELQRLQYQISSALQLLQQEITIENINTSLYNKYRYHNQRAHQQRSTMIRQYLAHYNVIDQNRLKNQQHKQNFDHISQCVGYDASCAVTLQTHIRAVTDREKVLLQQKIQQESSSLSHQGRQNRGLHVRDEIFEAIMYLIQYIKTESNKDPKYECQVFALRSILQRRQQQLLRSKSNGGTDDNDDHRDDVDMDIICNLTLLSFVRRCVEFHTFRIVHQVFE